MILGVGSITLLNATPDQAHDYPDGVYFGRCYAVIDGSKNSLLWCSINKDGQRFQLAMVGTFYGGYIEYLYFRYIYLGWVGPWKYVHGTVGSPWSSTIPIT